MKINLNSHKDGYSLSSAGVAPMAGSLCMANGLVYAIRHFQQVGKNGNNWEKGGHLALGLVQLIPVIGLISALFERVICRDRGYEKNISSGRRELVPLRIHVALANGTHVHADKVFKASVLSRDWYMKTGGTHNELVLSHFYSLFAPHSPQVRKTHEGLIAYRGIKESRTPQVSEAHTYKGIGSALFLLNMMSYTDRQLGNALVGKNNHFVLIDYELGGVRSSYWHDLYRVDHLNVFFQSSRSDSQANPDGRYNPQWKEEVDNALMNFLIFPFDQLQNFRATLQQQHPGERIDETFSQVLRDMQSIQSALLADILVRANPSDNNLQRVQEKLRSLQHTDENLAFRFKEAPIMRTVNIEAFESAAKERLDRINELFANRQTTDPTVIRADEESSEDEEVPLLPKKGTR